MPGGETFFSMRMLSGVRKNLLAFRPFINLVPCRKKTSLSFSLLPLFRPCEKVVSLRSNMWKEPTCMAKKKC